MQMGQINTQRLFYAAVPVLAGILATFTLFAQANSLLTGTVVDPSGAVVANAQVVCRNTQTGVTSTRATNANGLFRFPDLPIGDYELTVNFPGFEQLTRKGLTLLTGSSVDLHLQLEVGAARQA